MRRCSLCSCVLIGLLWSELVLAVDWNGQVNLQNRWYFDTGAEVSNQLFSSVAAQIGLDHAINDDADLKASIYARYDANDDERSNQDIRELMASYYFNRAEIGVGIGQASWGVNSIFKTLDFVNQTDRADLPFSNKMGQPMAKLLSDFGDIQLESYLLYDVRDAWYPGEDGRLRYPLFVDTDNAVYDRDGKGRLEFAGRLKFPLLGGEMGLSHFYGLNRNPYFVFNGNFSQPALLPVYEKINRSGLSYIKNQGDVLYKFEFAYQTGGVEQYESIAGGIEYAYGSVFSSNIEMSLNFEFVWDSREQVPTQLFDHDVGVAASFNFNDASDSLLMFGVVIDYKYSEAMSYGFFRRNFGDQWSMSLIGQFFHANEPGIDTRSFEQAASELLQELDAGIFPLDQQVLQTIADGFSEVTLNRKQFDIIVNELERLQTDENYVANLPIESIPQTLYDLLRVSDDSQKMNLIQRDSFIQLDINYHF